MENQLVQMGRRIREARTTLDISPTEMAELHNISVEEYLKHESGELDSSFTFLLRCAERFNVDISAFVTGESPKLSGYTLVRSGEGTPIKRRAGFEYLHQAARMKNRSAEPFVVRAPFTDDTSPIHLSSHAGQEFDYILEGQLKCQFEDKIEILGPGDSVYYDSGRLHGMVATGGKECVFLAVVIKSALVGEHEYVHEPMHKHGFRRDGLLYQQFMTEEFDKTGLLSKVSYHYPENYNFAFDVLDVLAAKNPDKLAMKWVSKHHEVRDFTFGDISRESKRAANYFASLGIGRGDRVMLVLKRHHQFWYILNALHRLGAVAVPASNQLMQHDFEYRFTAGNIKALICSGDEEIAHHAELAMPAAPCLAIKIMVNGDRPGWLNFDREYPAFPAEFERPAELRADDPSIMFFSSGTTGYPKMVIHSNTYSLGHIITARWWQNVDPDGLHFTISDTGWGKALWGKIYGQWLSEGAIFTYDFDRFDPADILPMFKRFNITTFCAPPTMYRFFIKEDLSKYDFSSLKYATTAGEALNAEVYQQFLRATGLKIMEGFGQTESTMLIGNLVGSTPKPGSMGKASPEYKVELVDQDDRPVAAGEIGEIAVKARPDEVVGLFRCYNCTDQSNAEAWRNGYYHTGDTAWCDEDGYFYYHGRTDDVIKSSGYRIGPFEIESILMELPYVLECAVTGAPDPVRGQVVKATVVLTRGTVGTDELKKEIQNYVKTNTAPYKYPRLVEFVEALPKTTNGKIRRAALRESDAGKDS
ncbi:MAG: AMP-binding protein [Victivallaceae bacterium]|nr:AMP-binding protein [Victivallaceae bacterium]